MGVLCFDTLQSTMSKLLFFESQHPPPFFTPGSSDSVFLSLLCFVFSVNPSSRSRYGPISTYEFLLRLFFSLFRFLIFCLQRVVLNFLLVTSIDWYVNWMRAEKSKNSLPRNALKTKENRGYSYLFVLLVCAIPIISRNCTPLQKEGWIERDAKTDYGNCHRP